MLFREINKLRLCLFLILLLPLLGSTIGATAPQTGTLVGGTLFVDESSRTWLGDAANITVELEHEERTISIVSDNNGDYIVKLAAGTYYLKSARNAENKPLQFSSRQPKCFKIKSNKDTRFDVMLLKP